MKPLYAYRPLLNGADIVEWAQKNGVTAIAPEKMHVTIAYSRKPVDWSDIPKTAFSAIETEFNTIIPEVLGPAVVLKFSSTFLQMRHFDFIDSGCSFDFPSYIPHVTVNYQYGSNDLTNVHPFIGSFKFGPEVWEELNLDWNGT